MATGLIAIVASGASLFFDFFPEYRPDPRAREGADVAVVAIEPGVARDAWLARTVADEDERTRLRREYEERVTPAGTTPDPAVHRVVGHVLFVRTVIEGYKRRDVEMRWSMYDDESRARVSNETFHDVRAFGVSLDAPTDESVVQLWVPADPGRERVFVRVELVAGDGTTLAVGDSPAFPGLAAR
jgi:hypothetical protein